MVSTIFSSISYTIVAIFLVATIVVDSAAVPEIVKRGGGGFPDSSCPDYSKYSMEKHEPFSSGPGKYPFQRPETKCRTWRSDIVDKVISEMSDRMSDPDLARLFENCFPNTLETTIRWYNSNVNNSGPRTFVITGDRAAEWFRDSRNQLLPYMKLAAFDDNLKNMLKGAVNLHADYANFNPYCNAYQAPKDSKIKPEPISKDKVKPDYSTDDILHCQFQVDSVANFFAMASDFYEGTNDSSFINDNWVSAAKKMIDVIKEMQTSTFKDPNNQMSETKYSISHQTDNSLGTSALGGKGNPLAKGTGLVRSFARPSDDYDFFPINVAANAMLAVELRRAKAMLNNAKQGDLAKQVDDMGKSLHQAVNDHGTFNHSKHGTVYAYEVDGYGSVFVMDDANVPNLLSLPDLGFCDMDDEVYKNTREMILSPDTNPFFLKGQYYTGMGSPHVGLNNAWPMGNALQIRTTDSDDEIKNQLELLKNSTAGLGLMHESLNVNKEIIPKSSSFTRPWFAWMNSEFAMSILDLAKRKPQLIFKKGKQDSFDIVEFAKSQQKNQKKKKN